MRTLTSAVNVCLTPFVLSGSPLQEALCPFTAALVFNVVGRCGATCFSVTCAGPAFQCCECALDCERQGIAGATGDGMQRHATPPTPCHATNATPRHATSF